MWKQCRNEGQRKPWGPFDLVALLGAREFVYTERGLIKGMCATRFCHKSQPKSWQEQIVGLGSRACLVCS